MFDKTDICLICLRPDRKLKVIDCKLSEFHDELSDFSVQAIDPRYCTECEYLLRKLYNFKIKCLKTIKILKNWKKTKAALRKPMTELYTLLPASTLEVWSPDTTKVYLFEYKESGVTSGVKSQPLSDDISTIASAHGQIVIVPIENIVKSQHLNGAQKTNITHNDIKIEIDNETDAKTSDLQEFLTFKTEKPALEEISLKTDGNVTCDDDTDSVQLNANDSDIDSILNGLSSDEDIKICLKDIKNTKYNTKTKSRKRSVALSDTTDSDVALKNLKTDNKARVTKKKIASKGDSKRRRERVRKKKIDNEKNKKERFHTTRDIVAELTNFDKSNRTEDCKGMLTINKKNGEPTFCKETLKSLLSKRFVSCGELQTSDGTVIDKEFILSSLDYKVTEFVMRQLWNAVVGKSTIKPRALKLLKCIQNKYKNEYESMFNVDYLSTTEKMLEEFDKRKTYECYVNAEYKCEVCYQGFKHEKKLEYHKKCHDETAGEFVCVICAVRQKSKKSLVGHMKSHEAVYKCKMCPLITYYKLSMVNHYNWHKGVKYKCEPCDVTFTSLSAFRSHQSYQHARRHVCTECGRAYHTRVGLKWHTTRYHRDMPQNEDGGSAHCEACDLTFRSAEVYLNHVRVTHETAVKGRPRGTRSTYRTRYFGTVACGMITKNKSKTCGRIQRPRKQPVLTCRVCNAVGSSYGWLSLHFRLEHPTADISTVYADKKTHLCEVCGKGFSTIYTLRAHTATHTGARPFACASCPARFQRSLSLYQHGLMHRPPAQSCQHCGKKFRSKSNLSNHMRFHVGDRRYKCKICGKGFLHRSTLNEHVRGVHHNVRRVRKRGVTDTGDRGLSTEEGGH